MKGKMAFLVLLFLSFMGYASAAPNSFYSGAEAAPRIPDPQRPKQSGLKAAASGHSVGVVWTASASASGCTSPCVFGYNIYRGTAAGAENLTTPLNATPVTGTSYTDSTIALGSSPVTYFYVLQAVETITGVTVNSPSSNEVSVTFPGVPLAPTALTVVSQN